MTPLIVGDTVYVLGSQGKLGDKDPTHLFALDLKSGAQRWASKFVAQEIFYANASEVVVADVDKKYHTLNPTTGAESAGIAESKSGKWVYASQVGDRTYALETSADLTATGKDGKQLWKIPIPVNRFRPLLIQDGLIAVAGTTYKGDKLQGAGLFLVNAATGKPVGQWRTKPGRNLSRLLIAADTLYFIEEGKSSTHRQTTHGADGSTTTSTVYGEDENMLRALDVRTGKERWKRPTNGDGGAPGDADAIGGPLFVEGDTLYVRETPKGERRSAGTLYRGVSVKDGSNRSETIVSRDHSPYGPPIHEGPVLYSSGTHTSVSLIRWSQNPPDWWVSAFDLKTGKEIWNSKRENNTWFSQPAVAGGLVVVSSSNRGGEGPTGVLAFPAPKHGAEAGR